MQFTVWHSKGDWSHVTSVKNLMTLDWTGHSENISDNKNECDWRLCNLMCVKYVSLISHLVWAQTCILEHIFLLTLSTGKELLTIRKK